MTMLEELKAELELVAKQTIAVLLDAGAEVFHTRPSGSMNYAWPVPASVALHYACSISPCVVDLGAKDQATKEPCTRGRQSLAHLPCGLDGG
eukprot:NODE_28591_length_472_cov_3.852174.p1 GENE.NODE_28591_length_472_cov_3.852174~~NODE_28591_length_472_cov_3.852174.p1  ORF type:complete len:92 (+),score=17.74 NODE_28591_length_472_cov_3.852174:99-374(+)